jgi:hypothetical protein
MALQIALTKFAGVKPPESVLGFTWEQIHLALGAMAALMAIGWLLTDYGTKKIALWFEIFGGIALVVGAVMLQGERNTGAIGGRSILMNKIKLSTASLVIVIAGFASGVKLLDKVLGLSWTQVHLVLGFQATIMMLLAAIALLVGAVMRTQESPSESAPPAF